MENYLQILLNVTKFIENVTEEFPPSTIIQENAGILKSSLHDSLDYITQSSSRLNYLIDNSLKELQIMQKRHEDKLKIIAIPQLDTLEILGNLSGSKTKIIQFFQDYKTEVLEQFESSWQKELKKIQDKWFINEDGTIKKGIGWSEKDGFMKDIKTQKEVQIKQLQENIESKIKFLLDQLQQIISLNKMIEKLKLLNQYDHDNFAQKLISLQAQIDSCYKLPKLTIEISNKFWGDLTLSNVERRNSFVMNNLTTEIKIIFDQRTELISEVFDKVIEFSHYFLEKQIFYQKETPEQLEAEKQWIEHQIEQLQEIQKSLNYILNFQKG